MKTPRKVGLIVLTVIVLVVFSYIAILFLKLAWFLVPSGILLAGYLISPIVAATSLPLSYEQKESLRKELKMRSEEYTSAANKFSKFKNPIALEKVVFTYNPQPKWILWCIAGGAIMAFLHGWFASFTWSLGTLFLLYIDIHAERRQAARKEIAKELFEGKTEDIDLKF